MTRPAPLDTTGYALALGAYAVWGVLPLYFHLLADVPALQVLAHRVAWSVALLIVIVLVMKRGRAIRAATHGRTLLLLAASSTLIALNWLIYIWAVQNNHVLESSLGYFINPLANIALGILVLGERLRKWQGVAIAIAAVGVVIMAVSGGGNILISLSLTITFALYGLVRKVVAIDSLGGLTVETLLLAPLAIGWLIYSAGQGTSGFGITPRIDILLLCAGFVTATPLLMFAAAARRLPLSTMGLFQYLSPTLQFLVALWLGEPLLPIHLVTFGLIWAGCALYAWDSVRAVRAPMPRDVKPNG